MLEPDEIDGRCLVDHEALSQSIDKLVEWGGYKSRSALSVAAGLDAGLISPSSFMRGGTGGGPKWLSLPSLLKLCAAAGLSIVDWALLYQEIAAARAARRPVAYTPQDIAERMGAAA